MKKKPIAAQVDRLRIRIVDLVSPSLCFMDPMAYVLFGDNLLQKGTGGQACIRGIKNAIGIPTKKKPTMDADAFFTDDEYGQNIEAIELALARIPQDSIVYVPRRIGAGRAMLPIKAPKTYKYLVERLALDAGTAKEVK